MKSFCNLCLLFAFVFSESDDQIVVRMKSGSVIGKRESFEGQTLNVFLGIPYAKPPIGELRFQRPQPVDQLSEPFEATKWSSACFHEKLHQNYFNGNVSEDCLYLNIWSPSEVNGSELKPVLFWIHGGGLEWGSASEHFYSGQVLAAKGDVVVVTFNYRLGIMGFLYTGSENGPGNMGLLDQVLALEWVNDNIKYFGGDPDRITIAGESAGSGSVSLHIVSPLTRHLFQSAILMSGSMVTKVGVCPNNFLKHEYRHYSELNNCTDDKVPPKGRPHDVFSPKIINCLKSLPAEQLVSTFTPHMEPCSSMVTVDGHYLPRSPLEMIENQDFHKGLNVLIGTVEDEGSFVLPMGIGTGVPYHKDSPPTIDYEGAKALLKAIFKPFIPEIETNFEDVFRLYFSDLSDDTEADVLRKRVGIALGDYILGCPTILLGKTLYEKDSETRVYQYYFKSKSGFDKMFCAKWMGVCHFDDIYPLFGLPFTDYHNYNDEERRVSQQMIEIFSQFVRSGRPSSTEWQPFYRIDDKIISPFYEFNNDPNRDNNFGMGLKITECEYVWSKFLMHLDD